MELIQTKRLWAFPMTAWEIQQYITTSPNFGERYHLKPSIRPLDEDVIELFESGILPILQNTPDHDHIWYTAWCIVARASQKPIGDFCFYAPPQPEGWTEIGYGIYPEFQSQGYMTEFLGALLEWCRQFPQLKSLKARTQPTNLSSNRLLERLGFQLTNEVVDGDILWEKWI